MQKKKDAIKNSVDTVGDTFGVIIVYVKKWECP